MYRDLATWVMGFAIVLAGCPKPGPAPLPPSGTAPAGAPSDAAMAGASDLRVLVPRSLDDEAYTLKMDPLDALAHEIYLEVNSASHTPPTGRIVIYADTTIDYGCLCPPFVFAPFYNSGRPDSYVLPIFAEGVPDPSPIKQGLFRFAGHFDGGHMTGIDWLKQRGGEVREGMSEYEHEAPVFIVEGWCFEPVEAFPDASAEENYGPALKEMEKKGRLCPGTRYPAPAKPDGT